MMSKIFKIAAIIILLAILGYYLPFSGKPLRVGSDSMQPAIHKGDRIIADLTYYSNNKIERGDIVAFSNPKYPERIWVKRIVALGGETIEINNGKVLINGKVPDQNIIKKTKYTNFRGFAGIENGLLVPEESYFVLGDNSKESIDSRDFGPLPKSKILGKITQRYWPLHKIGIIE